MTATTAPEPVLVACAASASMVSSAHCCGRSGSPAACADGTARASVQMSALASARGVRMGRLCPRPAARTPLSGAYPLVLHDAQHLGRGAGQRLARLMGLDERDRLRRGV